MKRNVHKTFTSSISTIKYCSNKGAHSPDMRVLAMGIYPIQRINSQVVDQDDVSKLEWSALSDLYYTQKTNFFFLKMVEFD